MTESNQVVQFTAVGGAPPLFLVHHRSEPWVLIQFGQISRQLHPKRGRGRPEYRGIEGQLLNPGDRHRRAGVIIRMPVPRLEKVGRAEAQAEIAVSIDDAS